MRYSESKQQTSELLRLIVPMLSKHEAACNPHCYAIWYEYLAGVNPALKMALDQVIDASRLLTDADVELFYQRFVEDRDIESRQRQEEGLKRAVDSVSGLTSAANARASDFAESLFRHDNDLSRMSGTESVRAITQAMLQDTTRMRETMAVLNEELRSTLKEVELLRGELERTQNQALIDPLTGLKNRRGLERVVEALQDQPADALAGCSVMMIDIDHFKRINDVHGHLFGDKVTRSVGQVLTAAVKGKDTVARWGGEEFLVLLPGTAAGGARVLADQIRSAIKRGRIRRADSQEYIGAVTVSIGVATHAGDDNFQDLVRRADEALYKAKRAGRNRVEVESVRDTVPDARPLP
ncbi:MAG: GGDEF domain-containing protein, partial [Betaproteobacteria bacterium]|nr:GGDEF domain-containing protein [Betaproteobacteria bacterium]